jgi:hypothetical protein
MGKLQVKLDNTVKQIAAYQEKNDVALPEIQSLVAEWKSIFQELSQMEDMTELFKQIYHAYMENTNIINANDKIYGEGSTVFVGKAMEYYDTRL